MLYEFYRIGLAERNVYCPVDGHCGILEFFVHVA